MALHSYLNRIQRLDALIRQKRTGSPKELARKLGISERWLYNFLDEIKSELDCPIRYNRMKRSYVYEKPGKVLIGFWNVEELNSVNAKKINGGAVIQKKSSHCIYPFSMRVYFSCTPLTIN